MFFLIVLAEFFILISSYLLAKKWNQEPIEWLILALFIGPLAIVIQYFMAQKTTGNP